MAGRAREQAHHNDGSLGPDVEPPLAGAIAQRPVEPFAPRLQLLSGDGAGSAGWNGQPHLSGRSRPFAVNAADHHFRGLIPWIDEPQAAYLFPVAARVEEGDPVAGTDAGREVVHRGQESVRRAQVGQHFDVELTGKLQTPITGSGTDARGKPLQRIAILEVA